MNIKNKTGILLALCIVLSLLLSIFYMTQKQGYHEDELLTYNLSNTSKQIISDGSIYTANDFNDFLTVDKNERFDFLRAYENQVNDSAHPPLYYILINFICSFFPAVFSKWFAFSLNAVFMSFAIFLLYKIAKRITNNQTYALIATFAYSMSIACITTTIYLRMYAMLTFFVLAFLYQNLKLYDNKAPKILNYIIFSATIFIGTITHYYFILFELLTIIIFIVLKIKEKHYIELKKYIVSIAVGCLVALCVYPYIITNILIGDRSLSSYDLSVNLMTIITYGIYKLCTYAEIVAKEIFIGQIWLFAVITLAIIVTLLYRRFFLKKKLSHKLTLIIFPTLAFFIGIALLSPFNSDRYIMASLPIIVMLYVFALINALKRFKNKESIIASASVILIALLGLGMVTPNYVYGKTNLYNPVTDNCIFVGTPVLEWNKCIDKLMQYKNVQIVQTNNFSPTLLNEIEDLAEKRGIYTGGKIGALVDDFISDCRESDSSETLSQIEDNNLNEVTVYISRLADKDMVIKYITENTKFKNYELIQSDYSFDDFYNWYDYFISTESYCNVYRFY